MYPIDPHGCLRGAVRADGICRTFVNRCDPSEGRAVVCAFAPDGGAFITALSDNDILTGNGWQFIEPRTSFPNPGVVPEDQIGTAAEANQCVAAACFAFCPGVDATPIGAPNCSSDGGVAPASDSAVDAASDTTCFQDAQAVPGRCCITTADCDPTGHLYCCNTANQCVYCGPQ